MDCVENAAIPTSSFSAFEKFSSTKLIYINVTKPKNIYSSGNVVKADAKPYSPYVLSLSLALRYLINPSFTLLQFILHWEFERVQARNLLSKPLKRS
uniref:Uncharacterized protein n=1 Tax=Cucumis melo TaxID=3656 RepID=A0A9I9E644_CUCME